MTSKDTSGHEHPAKTEPTLRQALLQEIGSKLTQAREACQQPIEKPARKLKLQKRHLEALESGNWEILPDDVYVLGFLRQYSHYLNVDLSNEIHRLKNDQYTLTKPLTFPDPPVAPSRRWAWIAGGAFVLLFIVLNITTGSHISANNNDIELMPLPVETETAISTSKTTNTPIDNPAPIQSASTTPLSKEAPVVESVRPAESTKSIASAEARQTISKHHFRFDAIGSPVWLQISLPNENGSGKGSLLKEVLLQPGFHVSFNEETELVWITCGNAPALQITVDGTVAAVKGSLGTGKKVLRDYPFRILRN